MSNKLGQQKVSQTWLANNYLASRLNRMALSRSNVTKNLHYCAFYWRINSELLICL